MKREEANDPRFVHVASPGVGAAANCIPTLVNAEEDEQEIKIGVSNRRGSPGVGANSPYYGRDFFATSDIPAGGEIFIK